MLYFSHKQSEGQRHDVAPSICPSRQYVKWGHFALPLDTGNQNDKKSTFQNLHT